MLRIGSSAVVFLILLLVLYSAGNDPVTVTLLCYTCTGTSGMPASETQEEIRPSDEFCLDIGSAIDRVKVEQSIRSCHSEYFNYSCVTEFEKLGTGEQLVSRRCGRAQTEDKMGCRNLLVGSVNARRMVKQCVCDKDLCNAESGGTEHKSREPVLVAIVSILLPIIKINAFSINT